MTEEIQKELKNILMSFLNESKKIPEKKYYSLAEICYIFNVSKQAFLNYAIEYKIKLKEVKQKGKIKTSYFLYEVNSTNKILVDLGYPKIKKNKKASSDVEA